MSMPSRCERYGVSTRSQPATSAPQACARSAYALIPAPPIPAIQRRLPARGCEGEELIGYRIGVIRLSCDAHGIRQREHPSGVVAQFDDDQQKRSRRILVV